MREGALGMVFGKARITQVAFIIIVASILSLGLFGAEAWAFNPLIHSSDSTGSTKWPGAGIGGWGIAGVRASS